MNEHHTITEQDSRYPYRLRQIQPFYDDVLKDEFSRPKKILVDGSDLGLLNSRTTISIVGTRSPFHKAFEIGEMLVFGDVLR